MTTKTTTKEVNPFFDLQPMLFQCNTDETLSPSAKAEYARLHKMSLEEGYSFLLLLNDITDEQDNSLHELKRAGYLTMKLVYRGSEGHFLHIDLRGAKHNDNAPAPVSTMQDTGMRRVFKSGAVRDSDEGKSRPDLVSPFALERIGNWLMLGSKKYEPRNWEAGMEFSAVTSSLHRHLMKYMQCDKHEDNLAAIATNAIFLMHYETMIERGILPENLNDLPKYNEIPRVHFNQDESYEVGEEP